MAVSLSPDRTTDPDEVDRGRGWGYELPALHFWRKLTEWQLLVVVGSGMVWLLLFSIYAAPDNATNWDGPWKLGMSKVIERPFGSEAECRNSAIQFIGKMHEGMLAPMRYKCVPVAAGLPAGAPR